MTRKGAVFKWTKGCDAAFKLLKEKFMEEPVLTSPQVNEDYVIHCDASKYSYSGILEQTRPGTDDLAPVAHFGGNFNKTQVKVTHYRERGLCYLQISQETCILHH